MIFSVFAGMARKIKHDLQGQRFGFLKVSHRVARPAHLTNHQVYWLCQCDCGNEKIITTQGLLRASNPPSCGCERTSGNIKTDVMIIPKKSHLIA